MDPRLAQRARRILRRPVVARRHRRLGAGDVAVASYPRSGSNWFVMMLGELLIGEEVDFQTDPFPVIWLSDYREGPLVLPDGGRAVKTHEPFNPAYRRAIYLVRHPSSVALSSYRGRLELGLPDLELAPFLTAWAKGEIGFYGTWQENVESWLDAPVPVMTIKFEDLLADPRGRITDALGFLGLERSSEEIDAAVAHNDLDGMRDKAYRAREIVRGGDSPMQMHGGGRDWTGELPEEEFELLRTLLHEHAGRAMRRLGYELPERPRPGAQHQQTVA